MDAEQQVRLKFLDEADECCDRIESSLLEISNAIAEPAKLDLALRSSHSIKGGAAMMGYPELSQSAHHLEDFLKILRVRYANTTLDSSLETLLLQGVDRLRDLADFYRTSQPINEAWIQAHLSPIFEQLKDKLGDLNDQDENFLLAHQSGDSDPALLMFEEGVETIVEDFGAKLPHLAEAEIEQTLVATAQSLIAFGYMAELDPFIQLCNAVIEQAAQSQGPDIQNLASQALTAWRRSYALVLRGSLDKLPNTVSGQSIPPAQLYPSGFDTSHDAMSALTNLPELEGFDDPDLASLQTEFSALNFDPSISETVELIEPPRELRTNEEGDLETAAFELEPSAEYLDSISLDEDVLESLQTAFGQAVETSVLGTSPPEVSIDSPDQHLAEPVQPSAEANTTGKTIRISAEQLEQFNRLMSQLVLERNTLLVKMEQIKNDSGLLQRRIIQLSQSNTQLRKWYDRAATEGVIPQLSSMRVEPMASNPAHTQGAIASEFDVLELDQYSDLHLISQAQIETLVQLQEVSTDIDTGLKSADRTIQSLKQTTQHLQQNLTQAQMTSFEEVVKRFPRLIRDMSQTFNKSVQLSIEGGSTLIDRAVTEALGDALLHLLRNAFDHGVEAPDRRIRQGKPAQGEIVLRAENRSNETVITLSDDGTGIQLDKIRDRLLQMGFETSEVETIPERELVDFIFDPGFSTASQVTEVSGRGVGLDLVRAQLQDIRGEVSVLSQAGVGTTFTLRIPFNLSIINVVLMERSGIFFALPVDSVREVTPLYSEAEQSSYPWNDQSLPLIKMEQYFHYRRPGRHFSMSGSPVINQDSVVITGRSNQLGAIALDRFWGEQEVTLRPISKALPMPPGFTSSLILGDGRVVPLLDPVHLVDWCLAQSQDAPSHDSALPIDPNSEVQEPTILVVDDSINVRKLLTIVLEKAGYRVEQARDGQDAVDRLRAGLKVSAVICDIEMPRLDGYGFLEEIKGSETYQDLPVVMLTSRSNDKHRKIAINLGATDYLSKPYNEDQLLRRLKELVTVTG